jgi:Co/Zn/Cd efflux system component
MILAYAVLFLQWPAWGTIVAVSIALAGIVAFLNSSLKLRESIRELFRNRRESKIEAMVRDMLAKEEEVKKVHGSTVWATGFHPSEDEDPELFKEAIRRFEQRRDRK